jgi:DNA-binding GntR family transcriptional regulator
MGEECLASCIYKKIKKKIHTLEFRPGQVLQERALAEMFGTSRTTIHSAVQKLEFEGWLVINARKNLVVKDVTESDVNEIFAIRRLLEQEAIEEIFRRDLTWDISFRLEELVVRLRRVWDDYFAYMRSDQDFHGLLVSVLENERLSRFYSTVREEFLRLGIMIRMGRKDKENMLDAHMKIVEAMRNKDLSLTRECLLDHLEKGRADILEALSREKKA